ncbi:MAG: cytochrome b/b6 domain-containing protein [Candidatus Dormibacteria bacterium]
MSAGPGRVRRFGLTERVLHWTVAVPFLVLLGTGLIIYFPALSGMGHRDLVRATHIYAGLALVLAVPLVLLFGDRRRLVADLAEADAWDRDDLEWARRELLRRENRVPQGRFNSLQKANVFVTGAALLAFSVTGGAMYYWRPLPTWLPENANLLHDALTFLMLPVVVGHIYLSVVNPLTRPSLRGVLDGTVSSAYARRHHPKWPAVEDPRS